MYVYEFVTFNFKMKPLNNFKISPNFVTSL